MSLAPGPRLLTTLQSDAYETVVLDKRISLHHESSPLNYVQVNLFEEQSTTSVPQKQSVQYSMVDLDKTSALSKALNKPAEAESGPEKMAVRPTRTTRHDVARTKGTSTYSARPIDISRSEPRVKTPKKTPTPKNRQSVFPGDDLDALIQDLDMSEGHRESWTEFHVSVYARCAHSTQYLLDPRKPCRRATEVAGCTRGK